MSYSTEYLLTTTYSRKRSGDVLPQEILWNILLQCDIHHLMSAVSAAGGYLKRTVEDTQFIRKKISLMVLEELKFIYNERRDITTDVAHLCIVTSFTLRTEKYDYSFLIKSLVEIYGPVSVLTILETEKWNAFVIYTYEEWYKVMITKAFIIHPSETRKLTDAIEKLDANALKMRSGMMRGIDVMTPQCVENLTAEFDKIYNFIRAVVTVGMWRKPYSRGGSDHTRFKSKYSGCEMVLKCLDKDLRVMGSKK